MNDAIFQVANKHFASFKGRKAVIVLTDGMVSKRAVTSQQVMDILQKSDTLFYPIIFKTKFYTEAMSRAAMRKSKPDVNRDIGNFGAGNGRQNLRKRRRKSEGSLSKHLGRAEKSISAGLLSAKTAERGQCD
jgi:hypothetical protein